MSMTEAGDIEQHLADAVSTLSLLVVADQTPESTLERIVEVLMRTIDHADGAGVSLVNDYLIQTVAATSDLQRQMDDLQTAAAEGPCLEAIRDPETRVVRIDDLSSEVRWPRYCRAAWALGVASKIAFVLDVEREVLGALSLYAIRPSAFDSEDETIGCIFANHAAVALANAQTYAASQLKAEQLQEALHSRDLVGRAKGILMERDGLTEDEAFARLRRIAMNLNVKLRDVAALMTGATPTLRQETGTTSPIDAN